MKTNSISPSFRIFSIAAAACLMALPALAESGAAGTANAGPGATTMTNDAPGSTSNIGAGNLQSTTPTNRTGSASAPTSRHGSRVKQHAGTRGTTSPTDQMNNRSGAAGYGSGAGGAQGVGNMDGSKSVAPGTSSNTGPAGGPNAGGTAGSSMTGGAAAGGASAGGSGH